MLCDFCAKSTEDSDARTHYTDAFSIDFPDEPHLGQITTVSFSEDWLACPECDKLIGANETKKLLERAKKSYIGYDYSADVIQTAFWQHRKI
jgi:hypothetical protein